MENKKILVNKSFVDSLRVVIAHKIGWEKVYSDLGSRFRKQRVQEWSDKLVEVQSIIRIVNYLSAKSETSSEEFYRYLGPAEIPKLILSGYLDPTEVDRLQAAIDSNPENTDLENHPTNAVDAPSADRKEEAADIAKSLESSRESSLAAGASSGEMEDIDLQPEVSSAHSKIASSNPERKAADLQTEFLVNRVVRNTIHGRKRFLVLSLSLVFLIFVGQRQFFVGIDQPKSLATADSYAETVNPPGRSSLKPAIPSGISVFASSISVNQKLDAFVKGYRKAKIAFTVFNDSEYKYVQQGPCTVDLSGYEFKQEIIEYLPISQDIVLLPGETRVLQYFINDLPYDIGNTRFPGEHRAAHELEVFAKLDFISLSGNEELVSKEIPIWIYFQEFPEALLSEPLGTVVSPSQGVLGRLNTK